MTPATGLAALSIGVNITFKAFQNVVAGGKPGSGHQAGRLVRTDAATAEEHQQGFSIDLLFELVQEIRVDLFFRVAFPFDFHCAGDAPDPVSFGTGTYVDQPGTGRQLPDFTGFGGGQSPGIGKREGVRPVAGEAA